MLRSLGFVLVVVVAVLATTVNASCSVSCGIHGQCVDAQCICTEGWTGSTCALPTCVNPIDGTKCSEVGTCTSGNVCICKAGRTGPTCRDTIVACGTTNLQHVNYTTCTTFSVQLGAPVHGTNLVTCTACNHTCLSTSTRINPSNCELLPLYVMPTLCPSDTDGVSCSGHGQCGLFLDGVCACSTGYSGNACQTAAVDACLPGRKLSGGVCQSQNVINILSGDCGGGVTCTTAPFTTCTGHGSVTREPLNIGSITFVGAYTPIAIRASDDGRYLAASSTSQLSYVSSSTLPSTDDGTEWVLSVPVTNCGGLYNTRVNKWLCLPTLGLAPVLSTFSSSACCWFFGYYNTAAPDLNIQIFLLMFVANTVSTPSLIHPTLRTTGPPVEGYLILSGTSPYQGVTSGGALYTGTVPAYDNVWNTTLIGGTIVHIRNRVRLSYLSIQTTCSGSFSTFTPDSNGIFVLVSSPVHASQCNSNGQVVVSSYFRNTPIQQSSGIWISDTTLASVDFRNSFGQSSTVTGPSSAYISFSKTGTVELAPNWIGSPGPFPAPESSFQFERVICNCTDGYRGEVCSFQPVGTATCTSPSVDPVAGGYIADSHYGSSVCTNGACARNNTNGYCACSTVYNPGAGYSTCVPGSATTVCSQPGCGSCPGGTIPTYLNNVAIPGGDVDLYLGFGCCPSAYTDSTRNTRTICGSRGTCARDGTCICNSGLGGRYCCPIGSNGVVCGPHGVCNDKGGCDCEPQWQGTTCQIDNRCGTASTTCGADSGHGVCVTADPMLRNLDLLHAGEPAFSAPSTVVLGVPAVTRVNTPYPGTTNTLNIKSWNVAILLRRVFLAYDPTTVSLSPWWVNPSSNNLTISEDVYGSMLRLWELPLFQSTWVGTGIDFVTRMNTAFQVLYPGTAFGQTRSESAAYTTALLNALSAAAITGLRDDYMRPLLAILIHQVLRDPVTLLGGTYPGLYTGSDAGLVGTFASSQCVCALGYAGDNCQNSCPLGTVAGNGEGQTCSGYIGANQLGTCTTGGTCACSFSRAGLACDDDLTNHCFAAGATQRCSGRGSCITVGASTYQCFCNTGWTGSYCQTSLCGSASTECSNEGTCDNNGVCTCNALHVNSTGSLVLPIGPLCATNGAPGCAVLVNSVWTECANRGECLINSTTNTPGCVCSTGYSGSRCTISLCTSPVCNANQTCDTGTGTCLCLPRYTGTTCSQQTCGFGVPDSTGANCICQSGYRADLSTGRCTAVQCPLVQVVDTGPQSCPSGATICDVSIINSLSQDAAYAYAHANLCCYDQCVKIGGDTNCLLNATTGVRRCDCSPATGYTQLNGICTSKCNGQGVFALTSPPCSCNPSWPLYPPLDTTTEYQTLSTCARVSCLNGGIVATSGQSCQCPAGFAPPTCATAVVLLSSSAPTVLVSSSAIAPLPSSSASPLPSSSSSIRSSSTASPLPSSSAPSLPSSSSASNVVVSSSAHSLLSSSSSPVVVSSSGGNSNDIGSSSGVDSSTGEHTNSNSSSTGIIETDTSTTLSTGAIVGIAVGGAVGAAGLSIGIWQLVLRLRAIPYAPVSGRPLFTISPSSSPTGI